MRPAKIAQRYGLQLLCWRLRWRFSPRLPGLPWDRGCIRDVGEPDVARHFRGRSAVTLIAGELDLSVGSVAMLSGVAGNSP